MRDWFWQIILVEYPYLETILIIEEFWFTNHLLAEKIENLAKSKSDLKV